MLTTVVVSLVAGILLGFAAGFLAHRYLAARGAAAGAAGARTRRADAEREAKGIVREAEIQARAEVLKAREAFESSVKEQRRELNETASGLNKREQSLVQREENLDRKADVLDRREDSVEKKAAAAEKAAEEARAARKEADSARADADARLERLAGMTREQARKDLAERAQRDIQGDLAVYLRRERERAEGEARRTAQKIVLESMQRYAGSHAAETMTRSVSVPGEDVKGRIIGREGRNIRALEAATGCSILVDDTPDAVIVSAADPLRREIAATALERLLASGRIQPQRIEEVVESVRQNWDARLLEIGSEAAAEADVALSSEDETRALGRLRFRTSFSQNVLRHSVEVARYAGMMAAELGLDPAVARRVGLLHDVGKALDETASGPHALAGADFLRKCGEPKEVADGVAGHHGETEEVTLYATLASVADALSSARPGARSESSQLYLERMDKLEKIAASFPGVARAFAVQAGRDLRVIVDPDATSDEDAMLLASRIAAKIEQEMQFPGQVRVTVVREKRCVEFAR